MYVAARERGLTREDSAVMAGYPADQKAGEAAEKSPNVQDELAKARKAMAASTGITREEVLKGLKDAADMASTMADPQAMVRAWSEIGKMLGFYAPDKKVHVHELGKATQDALRNMADDELLRLAHGRVVEGIVTAKKEEPDVG